MKNFLLSCLIVSTCTPFVRADISSRLNVATIDGTTCNTYPYKVIFLNANCTDNGNGTVSISITGGSGTPGGTNTQLQYNNANAFGGAPNTSVTVASVTINEPVLLGSAGADVTVSSNTILGQNGISNVIVGTNVISGPEFLIINGNANGGFRARSINNGPASGAVFKGSKARGNWGTILRTKDGDTLTGVNGFGWAAADNVTAAAEEATASGFFRFISSGDVTASNAGTIWTLTLTPVGSVAASERIRVDDQGHVGINTTAPVSNLDVYGQISDNYAARISTSSAGFSLAVTTNSHVVSNGPTPTMGTCGATPNPSVVGDDNQGIITVGGGVVTACTMNFSQTWGSGCNVVCSESDNSTTVTGDISALSPTAITFSFSASLGGGLLYYKCSGFGVGCR